MSTTTRRAELYPRIVELREAGLVWREIGARLGISTSTASDYYHDPDGTMAAARKAKNNGVCRDCGGPTKNGGSKTPPERCRNCAGEPERRERIIAAWTRGDTSTAIAEREGMRATTVQTMIAYHRESRSEIPLHRRRSREMWDRLRELWNTGIGAPAVARELGMSVAGVHEMVKNMREAGIELRDMSRHNGRKTHCPRGHAYDEANTYRDPRGARHCRRCQADRQRERQRSIRSVGNPLQP